MILMDFSGVNLAIGVCVRGRNVVFSILGIGSVIAFSASTRVVNPIRTIFFVGAAVEFLTDAPIKEGIQFHKTFCMQHLFFLYWTCQGGKYLLRSRQRR